MRVMAVDYGDARTGVAVSDATGTLAGFTTVIHARRPEQVLDELAQLAERHGVDELVMGFPRNMDHARRNFPVGRFFGTEHMVCP